MKTQDAIEHFGGLKKLADLLGIWPQVIYQWGEYPPPGRQYELEVRTNGVLRAETEKKSG
jgi:DNA-binding transcriptional regulator YdaS (Cro superfamily)